MFVAFEFVEKDKPNFDLVTLAPPMVYGPIRHSVESTKELNQSNSRIYNLFVNSKRDAELPPNGLHAYVDVRVSNSTSPLSRALLTLMKDIATAHIKAATVSEASGQRFIVCAGKISSQEICDLLRKDIPRLAERTPEGDPGVDSLGENAFDCSSKKAKDVLRMTFRSKEDTIIDLGMQLLDIEKQ